MRFENALTSLNGKGRLSLWLHHIHEKKNQDKLERLQHLFTQQGEAAFSALSSFYVDAKKKNACDTIQRVARSLYALYRKPTHPGRNDIGKSQFYFQALKRTS